MYIWMWILFLGVPLAVFSATPNAPFFRHLLRLFSAFAIGYICLNMTVHVDIQRQWEAYNQCCKEMGIEDRCELEEHVKPVRVCPHAPHSGPPEVFMLFLFGWVSALGYTGLWELVWRVVYRSRIKNLGDAFEAKLPSTIVILLSIPTVLMAFDVITSMASR